MRTFYFILLVISASVVSTACQPPRKETYDAPAVTYDGKIDESVPLKIDSSIEKAVGKRDSSKRRKYQL